MASCVVTESGSLSGDDDDDDVEFSRGDNQSDTEEVNIDDILDFE